MSFFSVFCESYNSGSSDPEPDGYDLIGPGPPAFDSYLDQEHQEVLCLHHGDCKSALSLSHGQVLKEEGQDYEEAS